MEDLFPKYEPSSFKIFGFLYSFVFIKIKHCSMLLHCCCAATYLVHFLAGILTPLYVGGYAVSGVLSQSSGKYEPNKLGIGPEL